MTSKSIGALANRFMILAKRPKLSKGERAEARQLMGSLKQTGMSNQEISALSGGRWTPRSIKCYTPGIKAIHSTQYDHVMDLLVKLNTSTLTLEDVERTVAIQEELEPHNITLDDVIEVLFAAVCSSADIEELVHQQDVVRKHGLTPEKVSEGLSAIEELKAKGFEFDSLVMLLQAANNYGDSSGMLQALSTYSSLVELKQQVKAAEDELKKAEAARDAQQDQIEQGEERLAALAEPIEAHRKATELGFDEQAFVDLADLSQKFGGPKTVIQALKAYADYRDLENKIVEARDQLGNIKSAIVNLNSEYGSLTAAISMCRKLVDEHGFDLTTVETLLSTAKKYGESLEVIKAIEAYGRVEALLAEADKLNGLIPSSRQKIAQLDGIYEDTLKKLESLNSLAIQVGSEVGKVQCQGAGSIYVNQLLNLINNPYNTDFGPDINVALITAVALKAFTTKHESNFKHRGRIIDGLACLIMDLGGVNDLDG